MYRQTDKQTDLCTHAKKSLFFRATCNWWSPPFGPSPNFTLLSCLINPFKYSQFILNHFFGISPLKLEVVFLQRLTPAVIPQWFSSFCFLPPKIDPCCHRGSLTPSCSSPSLRSRGSLTPSCSSPSLRSRGSLTPSCSSPSLCRSRRQELSLSPSSGQTPWRTSTRWASPLSSLPLSPLSLYYL